MGNLSSGNYKAAINGQWGEIEAGKLLQERFEHVEFINQIIDYMINDNVPIEVKTCQTNVNTGQEKYPTRVGRFILNQEQHNFLVENAGLYIFIVKHENLIYGWKMLPAGQLNFKTNIQWDRLINRKVI
jgi:hypothetical protein